MEPFKILVTGASGYIGGTVLQQLISSSYPPLANASIHALIRGDANATTLTHKGIKPVLFSSLDAIDELEYIASAYDLVIHTASGFHTSSAVALIRGLAQRQKTTGKDVYYIHTSGTTNLADQPITGKYFESRIFSDNDHDIYRYMQAREKLQPYSQRTTDLAVVDTGKEVGVKTYIIMSPLIYGPGTGLFNRTSVQVPTMVRVALKENQAVMVDEGKGVWDHVHVQDLAVLYEIIAAKLAAGEGSAMPSGEEGIYFSADGSHTWKDLGAGIAKALKEKGVGNGEVNSVGLQKAAESWAGGNLLFAELGFASNSRATSERSRGLGWRPTRTNHDFEEEFSVEVKKVFGVGAEQ